MSNFQNNVAVIGCGYWGKNIVRNFAQLGVLRLVCDDNSQTLAKYKETFAVEGISDFAQVLEMPEVQAVAIATPASSHAKLAIQALSAGKDVFVEKPLALTIEDALAVKAAARQSDRLVMIGHLLEYHPALVKLRSLVAEGTIGKLRYLYSNRLSFGKVRTEENVMWSFAPHDICSILGFVRQLPLSVQACGSSYLGQVEDFCTINLKFAQNVNAHIFVSWLHPFKEHRLVVVGDSGTVVFDDVSRDAKLTLYEQRAESEYGIPVLEKKPPIVIPISSAEPLKQECQHFLQCIETRQEPVTNLQNGLDVLTVLQSAQTSLKAGGKSVDLKELEVVGS